MISTITEIGLILLLVGVAIIYVVVDLSLYIKRHTLKLEKSVILQGRLVGFRVRRRGWGWYDRRIYEENGYYMVPVFSIHVNGEEKTVAAENRDSSLSKTDIGKIMTVTYQESNDVLLGYDVEKEGYKEVRNGYRETENGVRPTLLGIFIAALVILGAMFVFINKG